MQGLELSESFETFTKLTIGDGLVAQIPRSLFPSQPVWSSPNLPLMKFGNEHYPTNISKAKCVSVRRDYPGDARWYLDFPSFHS